MKASPIHTNRPRSQRGSATIVVLVMLGIMMIFFATNLVTIKVLTRELKLVEKKQVERLRSAAPPQVSNSQGGARPVKNDE